MKIDDLLPENSNKENAVRSWNTRKGVDVPRVEEILKLIEFHSERITGYKIMQRPMKDLARAIHKRLTEGEK